MDSVSKSWFCVFNNPSEHGYDGEPQNVCDALVDLWISSSDSRTCAVAYCISADGLHHIHAVFDDVKAMRFSAIKKVFPAMHIEPTKGNKAQANDYIDKRGRFAEKGETVVCTVRHGEIQGAQGQRNDFIAIDEMLGQGMSPDDIFDTNIKYRKFEKIIRDAYYRRRYVDTPIKRNVVVYWHVGESGTGKSYNLTKLVEEQGDSNVFLLTDYDNGGFDKYCGERILFMDEFRGQIPYNQLLIMLDGYRSQIHSRYTNIYALWDEVHITSVLPPEMVYNRMVKEDRNEDSFQQLKRRLSYIVYHYRDTDGSYQQIQVSSHDYKGYEKLQSLVSDQYIPASFFDNTFVKR